MSCLIVRNLIFGNAFVIAAAVAAMNYDSQDDNATVACFCVLQLIGSEEVLEAITTLKCNESFSMERLELLGDSVLKFAVSCDLYLEYATTQEGQLSSRRSWQVCNSTLYNLGIACRLQGYKRDTAFVPTGWTTPRQLTLKPFPCDHGIGTIEVPVESKYQTEDPIIHTGQCYDMGHRWLCAVHLAAT
ncbi:endoribonuclease Dicer homolog 3a isoform X1 [Tanacetum coccineum]